MASKATGALVALRAFDDIQAGFRMMVSGEWTDTFTKTGVTEGLVLAGVDRGSAEWVGIGADFGTGFLSVGDSARQVFRLGDGVAPRGVFRSGDDALYDIYGPARLSHPDEYAATMSRLEQAGVEIQYKPGQIFYSPNSGRPGILALDPDGSIGALRHEVRHFDDHAAAGFQRLGYYYENPGEFWRMEFRGYMEEINIARQGKHYEAGRAIINQMRARRTELLGQ